MNEIWKDVKGFEALYQVSNYGRVRSLPRKINGRSLKGVMLKMIEKKSTGYYAVSLHKNGKQTQAFVHRLVAEAFCEKQEGCDVVDHINTNSKDNSATNLRWTTTYGNVNNPTTQKRRTARIRDFFTGRKGSLHPSSKPVLQFTTDGTLVRKWKCASDAVRECGFDSGSITRCCKGEYKTHKGFLWRYDI